MQLKYSAAVASVFETVAGMPIAALQSITRVTCCRTICKPLRNARTFSLYYNRSWLSMARLIAYLQIIKLETTNKNGSIIYVALVVKNTPSNEAEQMKTFPTMTILEPYHDLQICKDSAPVNTVRRKATEYTNTGVYTTVQQQHHDPRMVYTQQLTLRSHR